MTTDCYANMADRLFESHWQQLPIDLQKYFILIIGNMHKPLYYHGSGVLILNLETFRDVSIVESKLRCFIYSLKNVWSKKLCFSAISNHHNLLHDVQSHSVIKGNKLNFKNLWTLDNSDLNLTKPFNQMDCFLLYQRMKLIKFWTFSKDIFLLLFLFMNKFSL